MAVFVNPNPVGSASLYRIQIRIRSGHPGPACQNPDPDLGKLYFFPENFNMLSKQFVMPPLTRKKQWSRIKLIILNLCITWGRIRIQHQNGKSYPDLNRHLNNADPQHCFLVYDLAYLSVEAANVKEDGGLLEGHGSLAAGHAGQTVVPAQWNF